MHALLLAALLMPADAITLAQPPKQPPVNDPTRNLPRDPTQSPQPPNTTQPNTNLPNTTTPQAPDQGFGNVNVNVDGTWTVLAYERNGAPVTSAGTATVTIRGNIMTLGNKQFRLRFGPRNMIFVTEITETEEVTPTGGTTKRTNPNTNQPASGTNQAGFVPSSQESGVYVLSLQFFCISVFENNVDTRDMRTPSGTTTTQPGANTTQPQTGNFVPGSPLPSRLNAVLILKRVGT